MDTQIQNLAQIGSSLVAPWSFKPTGKLRVNSKDTDALIGKISYANPNYEIGLAVKIGNWHFCVERIVTSLRQKMDPNGNPNTWMIGAFYFKGHYTFAEITAASEKELDDLLIKWVINTCWIFVDPEIKNPTWQIV